ncbi:MAG: hypothetical protein KKE73_15480 [Proteobacteria bacterium]|nr:hypothetical protein [Pseudomonadota bacterium]
MMNIVHGDELSPTLKESKGSGVTVSLLHLSLRHQLSDYSSQAAQNVPDARRKKVPGSTRIRTYARVRDFCSNEAGGAFSAA